MVYKTYYIETQYGCGLRAAKSKKHAWRNLLKAEGENNAICVREATKEDIAHVKSMGGYVPAGS